MILPNQYSTGGDNEADGYLVRENGWTEREWMDGERIEGGKNERSESTEREWIEK